MSRYKSTGKILFEISLGILAIAALAMMLENPGLLQKVASVVARESPTRASLKPDRLSGVSATQEVIALDVKQASPGFIVYPTSGSAEVLLVNLAGETVHKWDIDADRARLLPDCSLLTVHGSKWGLEREPWATLRSVLRRYSWDGEVLWERQLPADAHHDVQMLDNGNVLALYLTHVQPDEMIKQRSPRLEGVRIRSDVIEEITPEGESVWKWEAHNHLPLDSCGVRPCSAITEKHRKGQRHYDWTHINTISVLPENQWFDQGDSRFRPGNILLMARNFWQAMIVDKESKEVVWKYSGDYKGGISGGHEPVMLEPGLPGAGNILIFDNGRVDEESRILEINPVTQELVWLYDVGPAFFSRVAGAAQRLPNGNTLVSEDVTGRVFELNPEREVIWSYRGRKMRINRARRYAPEWCEKLRNL